MLYGRALFYGYLVVYSSSGTFRQWRGVRQRHAQHNGDVSVQHADRAHDRQHNAASGPKPTLHGDHCDMSPSNGLPPAPSSASTPAPSKYDADP